MTLWATGTTPLEGVTQLRSIGVAARSYCAIRSSTFALKGASSHQLFDVLDHLRAYKAQLVKVPITAAMIQLAKDEKNDQSYDISVKSTDVQAVMDIAIQKIITDFPKDGNNFLLAESIDSEGERSPRIFTASSLSGLIATLDAVVAAIS